MPTSPTLMIAGCGDVGSRLGCQLSAAGWTVYGLRRNGAALPSAIRPVAGNLFATTCPSTWPTEPLDYLVYCAAASQHDEAGYRATYVDGLSHVLAWLAQHGQRPKRLLFVSSTGVYAQSDGAWLDESAPAEAQGYSGRIMLEAEQVALNAPVAATVLRLAGIYGPGRQWLLNQVRAGYQAPSAPAQYSNRIHADDAAGLLAHLLQADHAGVALDDCYIGVDNAPAALHEVVEWLREQLGVSHREPPSSSRRAGSKRCSNARARALGWQPQYPSYREGYAAVLGESE
jgi:nucleoside-diphosphate-sugar epimerase